MFDDRPSIAWIDAISPLPMYQHGDNISKRDSKKPDLTENLLMTTGMIKFENQEVCLISKQMARRL